MSLPKMRTLSEAIIELRALDPSTAVTPHALRRMVLNGTVPHVQVGAKRLVNLDALLDYLSTPQPVHASVTGIGTIRPISEREERRA